MAVMKFNELMHVYIINGSCRSGMGEMAFEQIFRERFLSSLGGILGQNIYFS